LAALFATLIIVVILDASRIWIKAIRAREPLPTTEVEYVESKLYVPAGLFPTAEEKAVLAGADGGASRFDRERETTQTGAGP
jgi:carbon starvation protein